MIKLIYIGESQTYQDKVSGETIDFTKDATYELEIKYDGMMSIINGSPVLDPDSTIWLIFNHGGISIPYSPEAVLNFWRC